MIYKYNRPRITAFLPFVIGIVITDSIIILSCCPTKQFIQQADVKDKAESTYLQKNAFGKHSLIAQTEPRMYMTWCKVLMIEGGRKRSETEIPAEKVFNLQGVRYYILALSLTDSRHEGKNYLKHMVKSTLRSL